MSRWLIDEDEKAGPSRRLAEVFRNRKKISPFEFRLPFRLP